MYFIISFDNIVASVHEDFVEASDEAIKIKYETGIEQSIFKEEWNTRMLLEELVPSETVVAA